MKYGQVVNFVGGGNDLNGRQVSLQWLDETGAVLTEGRFLSLAQMPVDEKVITFYTLSSPGPVLSWRESPA